MATFFSTEEDRRELAVMPPEDRHVVLDFSVVALPEE